MTSGRPSKPKTHCAQGHEFTEENTSWKKHGVGKDGLPNVSRVCKQCRRDESRKRRERRYKEMRSSTPRRTTSQIIASGVFGKDCITLAEFRHYREKA